MYIVVFRNISNSISHGCITWTAYKDEKEFEEYQQHPNMQAWYKVIEKGVSEKRAIELCSTPEAGMMAILSDIREMSHTLKNLADKLQTTH